MPSGDDRKKANAWRRSCVSRIAGAAVSASAIASVLAPLLATLTAASESLRVVATTSDLAALARAVSGDLAQVETIIPPATDPEAFEPRPSDLVRLKGAAVIVRVGLGYDHWLDKLLATHGDASIQRGGAGYVDASFGVPLLEVKGSSVDPANQDGHAHGLANPHYWLDPGQAEIITGGIAEAMIRVAPRLTEKIIAGRDDLLAQLKTRLAEWKRLLAPYRGARLIAYHNTWPYFARRFRLNIVDVVEGKEGVSPSPGRLARLAATIRSQNIRVILHEPFEPDDASQLLARRTGAVVVKLAPSVFSIPAASGYAELFDYNVGTLLRALAAASN